MWIQRRHSGESPEGEDAARPGWNPWANMPVTPAHAAAAPLLRRLTGGRVALSAIVVGTMAPDFEYLVRLNTHRTIGHTVAGLFLLCLPSSLAVLLVWHRWLKRPLAALLPPGGARLAALGDHSFPFTPWARLAEVVGGILIGATSHLVWDGFTHRSGSAVHHLTFLQHRYGGFEGWRWAQYLSGALGLAYLSVAVWRWARRPGPGRVERPGSALPDRARRLRLASLAAVAATGALANAARVGGRPSNMAAGAAIGVMSAGALAAAGVALSLRPGRPR